MTTATRTGPPIINPARGDSRHATLPVFGAGLLAAAAGATALYAYGAVAVAAHGPIHAGDPGAAHGPTGDGPAWRRGDAVEKVRGRCRHVR